MGRCFLFCVILHQTELFRFRSFSLLFLLISVQFNTNHEDVPRCILVLSFQQPLQKSSHALLISKKLLTQFGLRVCCTNWWKVVLGGKTSDIIKHTYTNIKYAVKIGKKTHFFPQGRGVRQGCSLNFTLFNIYINELARTLELQPPSSPYLNLKSNVHCLLMIWCFSPQPRRAYSST